MVRSDSNKVIAGVCAGLAEAIDVNPIWVRLGFIASVLYLGFGLIPYLILWVLMPKKA